mmetsp:Transcript_7852/g.28912  ORF Transcript_7852/g.28912 Transcript_7852/m.28912 type:complete len:301 (+) Transcript_7852:1972-2874(+)
MLATGFPRRRSSLIIISSSVHDMPLANALFTASSARSTASKLYSINTARCSSFSRSNSSCAARFSTSFNVFSNFVIACASTLRRANTPDCDSSAVKYSSTTWSNAHAGSVTPSMGNSFTGLPSFCFNGKGEKSSKISIASEPSAFESIFVVTTGVATTAPVVTPSNQLSNPCTAVVSASMYASRTASSNGRDAEAPLGIPAVSATCSANGGAYPNALASASLIVPGERVPAPSVFSSAASASPSAAATSSTVIPLANAHTTSSRSYCLNARNRSSGYVWLPRIFTPLASSLCVLNSVNTV